MSAAMGTPTTSEHFELESMHSQAGILESRRSRSLSEVEQRRSDAAIELPPVDRGHKAWTFVACGFVIEVLCWGFPYSFGVFQEYYLKNEFRDSSETAVSSIGTISIALQYALLPICFSVGQRWPRHIRYMSIGGLLLLSGGLFLSSFVNEIWQLIILQGVVVGMGGSLLYFPILLWLFEWFSVRRALAGSFIFGGSGIGGTIFPLLINLLLSRCGGFRWTLRIMSLIVLVCGGVALLGIRPRIPIAPTQNAALLNRAPANYAFLKSPLFYTMCVTIAAQSIGYFPVSLYLPSYTTAVGLSTTQGTIALALFNLAGTLGQIVFGYTCDRAAYSWVIVMAGTGGALSAYLMWGFARSLGLIFAFVIIFGSLNGGFSSFYPPASADIAGPNGQPSLVMNIMTTFKGVAVVIGPIISASLHEKGLRESGPSSYGGYGFTFVELFVGSMMVVSALGGVVSSFLIPRRISTV